VSERSERGARERAERANAVRRLTSILLALHVALVIAAIVGVLPRSGPPFVYAVLLPFSLAHAAGRWGTRRAGALFAATIAITLVAETWGTQVGLFGARYAYVPEAWAPLPRGLVMAVVPGMWFMMMYPSFVIARSILGGARRHLATALVGGLVMTAWDLALDPVAVGAGLWRWSGGTPSLFGIPIENYVSWFLGSAIVIAIYSLADASADRRDRGDRQPVLAYGAVALLYVAIAPAGIGLAALATMGLACAAALARQRAAPRPPLELRPEWMAPPATAEIAALRRDSFRAHPVQHHFVNSLHLVVAQGERYMIGNLRRVKDRLDGTLLRQADWFIAQEAKHAAEHRRFSTQLARLGYRPERLDRLCRWIGQRLLPRSFGPAMNLAITVAIEHWTACVAEIVLRDGALDEIDPATRRLVDWHCVEELEHRAVAFDVFQAVSGSYVRRVLGFAVGVALVVSLSMYGMVSFLAQDRQLLAARAWGDGLRFFFLRQRLVLKTVPRALRLLRPGFHPATEIAIVPEAVVS